MGISNLFKKKGSSKKNAGKVFEAAEIIGEPSEADLRGIRFGVQSTVIMGIRCGGCGKEWKDAFYCADCIRGKGFACTNMPHIDWHIVKVGIKEKDDIPDEDEVYDDED